MPANTPHGAPYPLPTEPVAEGAQRIRELAEWIDPNSVQRIGSVTLAAAAAFMEFTAIPQNNAHLLAVVSGRTDWNGGTTSEIRAQVNGLTTGAYFNQYLRSTGSSTSSAEQLAATSFFAGIMPSAQIADARHMGHAWIFIPNYAKASLWKIFLALALSFPGTSAGSGDLRLHSGFGGDASPITALRVLPGNASNFIAGCRADLYGLR